MNKTVENFIREELLNGLSECTEEQQLVFKRMYSPDNLDASIDDLVLNMAEDKIDWALTQVETTLKKNQERLSQSELDRILAVR